MAKPIKKRIYKFFIIVFVVIITLVMLINIPLISFSKETSENDYSNWMSETLSDDQLIIDVAMLGAHDAFSSEINIFSELDPYETNGIMQGFTGLLIKGFIVKQAVTQLSDATTLLNQGVRYLDIRLSFYEESWYTKHNYISEEFIPITNQITNFLDDNPGEFLVLDFQHIDGLDYEILEDYDIFKTMLEDTGLLDYAYVVNDLGTLTYDQITNNGTESKIIIISKFSDSNNEIQQYDNSIRSNWADSDNFDYIFEFLQEEAELESQFANQFRIMQAVTTMQMSGSGILNALTTWSLIERAEDFNNYLIEEEGFLEILESLPIIMVDYSNTNEGGFNDNVMEIIMEFNNK